MRVETDPGRFKGYFFCGIMKHYLFFLLIVISIVMAYLLEDSFVKERYIPKVVQLNLPVAGKKKMFHKSNVNVFALIEKKCMVTHALAANRKALKLVLNVIYSSGKVAYCKINGSILRVGERLGPIKVEKIEDNRVLVSVNGKKRWLSLGVYATQKN